MSSGYRLDEAVLAIQEAATGITTVTKDIDEVKGRQEELLQSIHALNERISNIEQGSTKKEKQIRPFIPLYERVSFFWQSNCALVGLCGCPAERSSGFVAVRLSVRLGVRRALWPSGCQSGWAFVGLCGRPAVSPAGRSSGFVAVRLSVRLGVRRALWPSGCQSGWASVWLCGRPAVSPAGRSSGFVAVRLSVRLGVRVALWPSGCQSGWAFVGLCGRPAVSPAGRPCGFVAVRLSVRLGVRRALWPSGCLFGYLFFVYTACVILFAQSLVRAIYRDLSCETEHFNLDEG